MKVKCYCCGKIIDEEVCRNSGEIFTFVNENHEVDFKAYICSKLCTALLPFIYSYRNNLKMEFLSDEEFDKRKRL